MSKQNEAIPSLEDVLRKVEEYKTTIMAIQAISNIVLFFLEPAEEHVSIGRRMNTSAVNKIQPSVIVTPDVVMQVDDSWGLIVEVKRSLPVNHENKWEKTVSQLQKYDDDLQGWWTETEFLTEPNVSLLIDVNRSISFSNYVQNLIGSGDIDNFNNPTSIIEFFVKQEVKQFLHIRHIWGEIKPIELQNHLQLGKSISVEGLIDSKRFYDQEPSAIEYTMVLLWQNVFNERRLEVEFDEDQKAWLIEVDLNELTEDLQNLYGNKSNKHRECTYPRKRWIRKALDAFVKIDLATPTLEKDIYVIKFKRIRGEIFERFYKQHSAKKKPSKEEQLRLFESNLASNGE